MTAITPYDPLFMERCLSTSSPYTDNLQCHIELPVVWPPHRPESTLPRLSLAPARTAPSYDS